MLCQFQVHSKVNQLYICIYPLFFRFFPHIGHYRVLYRIPCAIQQVLISYLFYIQQCVLEETLVMLIRRTLSKIHKAFYRPSFFFFLCHLESQFPDQGSNPCFLQWKRGILTTGPPGNSSTETLSKALNFSAQSKRIS